MIMTDWLVWVDIETTGLDPALDHILEVALVITNNALDIMSTKSLCIRPSLPLPALHQKLNAFAREVHHRNGLWGALQTAELDLEQADQALFAFLDQELPGGTSPMCGQSVHFDRSFIKPHMPLLAGKFHYRNIDIRSVTQLAFRWHPESYLEPAKKELHRALPDLLDTIAEARYLKSAFFNPN